MSEHELFVTCSGTQLLVTRCLGRRTVESAVYRFDWIRRAVELSLSDTETRFPCLVLVAVRLPSLDNVIGSRLRLD